MKFTSTRYSRPTRVAMAAVGFAGLATTLIKPAPLLAGGPSQFEYYFNGTVSLGGGSGALGGFVYTGNTSSPQFYTLGFTGSTQGIYQDNYDPATSTWSSSEFINNNNGGTNDWLKFATSSSVAGSGTIVSNSTATPTVGDMILNPTSVVVGGINYSAGTLGIIIDNGKTKISNIVQPSLSKLVYAYDLRAVTYDPNTLLENNPSTPGYNDRNGDGIVEWNDVFTPIVSFADQQSLNTGYSASASNNVGRRPVFSTDGQSIYFTDISTAFGGLYKVNITQTGSSAISKLVNGPAGSINSEPAVISSSTRNFGGGTGDQVIFGGGVDTGNTGGINYVVDNGASTLTPKTLLSAKQAAWFLDQPAGGTVAFGSFASDSSGDLLIENSAAYNYGGVFEDDAQGRLVKLFSQAEQRWFEASESPAVAFNASVLELKIQPVAVTYAGSSTPTTINQLLYRDTNTKAPVGVNIYLPGDFNRDGVVNSADINLFKQQIGLRGVASATIATATGSLPINSTTDGSAYAASGQAALAANAGVPFLYDLNGSYTVTTAAASVDWKDVKIFQQFAGFSDGDVNMDGSVDTTDLNTLASNYGLDNKIWTDGKLSSVRPTVTDRNKVSFVDLVTLAANWTLAKPALGTIGNIPQSDLDRAFAITSGGTISQLSNTSSGSVDWGTAATWTNGIPNAAGAVASLLNKATNDTTVNIGSSFTVGQLNFDNYFTYTLSGSGTLHLAGNNGTSPELNTFAASPVISAGVSLDSPTNVTINYSTDTATFAGPISGIGGLTKLGAGAVLLSGSNTYRGGTSIIAGTLTALKPASLPGYNSMGQVTVASGSTLGVNTGGTSEFGGTDIDRLRANVTFASGAILAIDTTDAPLQFNYASSITNAIAINKVGTNTLFLSGSNSYTGGTMVTAGTLQVAGTSSLPGYNLAGKVTIAAGATLAVNVGAASDFTAANIDTLRSNATLNAGSALGIDTTDAPTGFIYTSVITGTGGLTKLGTNTLTLTGNSTYNGSTSVLSGTLQLNFGASTSATNIIGSTSALTLGGNGNLTVLGKVSTTNSQTFASATLNAGAAVVAATASNSNLLLVALGSVTRNSGATVDFSLPSGTQGATNGITTSISTSNGILGGWATVSQADWATKSTNNITALAAASYVNDTWASANNTTVTTSSAPASSSSTNSLRFNLAAANVITLSGVNNIATGGILITPSVGANPTDITGGTLTGKTSSDLIVDQYNTAGNFQIDSLIADSTGSTGLTKSGLGLLTLTAANSYTGPTYVNSGTLNVASGSLTSSAYVVQSGATFNVTPLAALSSTSSVTTSGAVNFAANPGSSGPAAITVGAIVIGNSGVITLNSATLQSNRSVLVTTSLGIAGGTYQWNGKLDLGSNDLVVHNGSLSTLTNQLATGYAGGTFTGNGITSKTAAANTTHLTTIGVILNNDGNGNPLYAAGTSLGLFDGLSLTSTDVLAKYTYYGDANLDGKVDGSDYSRIDNGYLSGATGWYNGDFNYDGVVNGSDYTLIDNAFNTQGAVLTSQIASPSALVTTEIAPSAGTAAVPEPTALGVMFLGATGLLGRRRRN